MLPLDRGRLLLSVATGLLAEEVRAGAARLRPPPYAEDEDDGPARQRAVRLRRALERLGPLYIKLGQVLATRQDILSEVTAAELEGLHDRADPLPFARLVPVLEAELGPSWRDRFAAFDTDEPLGSASLAQVYGARLAHGTPVVVKIQRPGVRALMRADMRLLSTAARLLARRTPVLSATLDFEAMLHVVFDAMRHELDFTLEAANMEAARAAVAPFEYLEVPEVLHATRRVLIQSRAPGVCVREADPESFEAAERERIGADLLTFMCRQYLIDRRFHADPHPGNVFVVPGGPATLIDWGMVGRIDRHLGLTLTLTLLGLAGNDARIVARNWPEMGRPLPWADLSGFHQDMAVMVPALHAVSLERMRFGASLAALLRHSTKRGIQTNPMIALLSKSFANAEGSVRCLAPHLSVTEILTRHTHHVVRHYARESLSRERLGYTALQALAAWENSLGDARTFTQALSGGELTLQHVIVQRRFSLAEHREDVRRRRLLRGAAALAAVLWWRGRS
ncbi:ABC1 kinase family protein [Streptomyces sp. URMC 126]|uniref:ABC1 kinase family protein n=1 Tax=Streptomyces sp. URMC 126 TaxID=3423401 RepID=UPI003F1E322A